MKTIKKLLALTLVLCMVFCLSVAVFADDTPAVEPKTVTIKKDYDVVNSGTTAPAETFYLKQVSKTVTESELKDNTKIPDLIQITDKPATIDSTVLVVGKAVYENAISTKTTQNITIQIPENAYPNVGVYTYELEEIDNGTAGVTYFNNNKIVVVVTVYWDENTQRTVVGSVHTEAKPEGGYDKDKTDKEGNATSKSDTFENKYEAGSLTVSKTVNGNLGDKGKKFSFTVTFTKPEGKNVNSNITTNLTTTPAFNVVFDSDGTYSYTFELSNGEDAKFENIPYGVKYKVKENLTGTEYTTTCKTNNTDTTLTDRTTTDVEINSASTTVAFTNTRVGEIDMGVSLDSLPYILALAVAFGGAVVLFTRKRHVED